MTDCFYGHLSSKSNRLKSLYPNEHWTTPLPIQNDQFRTLTNLRDSRIHSCFWKVIKEVNFFCLFYVDLRHFQSDFLNPIMTHDCYSIPLMNRFLQCILLFIPCDLRILTCRCIWFRVIVLVSSFLKLPSIGTS